MKWWPFRKRDTAKDKSVTVAFPPDVGEIAVLKYHGLRALCGAFMGRHSACRSPHPFCGEMPDPGNSLQLIAHVITQMSQSDGTLFPAIYLCRSEIKKSGDDIGELGPMEFALSMDYADETPNRKMAVNLVSDGTYLVQYGPIVNPVERDYSTGRLDQNSVRELYCNPEPSHTQWHYWESELSAEQTVVPEYRCIQSGGQWFVVDVDRNRGLAQQVAWLQVADDPEHNFGIHSRPGVYVHNNDASEYSKVINENLPRTFP